MKPNQLEKNNRLIENILKEQTKIIKKQSMAIGELIKTVNELWLYVGAIDSAILADKKSKIYKELEFRKAYIEFAKLGNFVLCSFKNSIKTIF